MDLHSACCVLDLDVEVVGLSFKLRRVEAREGGGERLKVGEVWEGSWRVLKQNDKHFLKTAILTFPGMLQVGGWVVGGIITKANPLVLA